MHQLQETLKALSDEPRLRILKLFKEGEILDGLHAPGLPPIPSTRSRRKPRES